MVRYDLISGLIILKTSKTLFYMCYCAQTRLDKGFARTCHDYTPMQLLYYMNQVMGHWFPIDDYNHHADHRILVTEWTHNYSSELYMKRVHYAS